jgi:hypothetical protein
MISFGVQCHNQFVVIDGGQGGDLKWCPMEALGEFDLVIVLTTRALLTASVQACAPAVVYRFGIDYPKG